MNKDRLKSKLRGCMLAAAAGDALGMPVENMTFHQIAAAHGRLSDMKPGRQPPGGYTDDTQLMIGLAECLVANGRVEQEDLARRFLEIADPWRGYGRVFKDFLYLLELGWKWKRAAYHIHSILNGSWNGSAMRVAPVGALFFGDLERLKREAALSGEVSHVDEVAQDGCMLQALAVALAMRCETPAELDSTAFLEGLQGAAETGIMRSRLAGVAELLVGEPDMPTVIKRLGNTVEVHNSVPAAIYAFLRTPRDLEETVVYAVSLGGDADTIAAMAGAISGALNGVDAIPGRWLEVLEHRDRIQAAADGLAAHLQ